MSAHSAGEQWAAQNLQTDFRSIVHEGVVDRVTDLDVAGGVVYAPMLQGAPMTNTIFDIAVRPLDPNSLASGAACRSTVALAARAFGNGTVLVEARTG